MYHEGFDVQEGVFYPRYCIRRVTVHRRMSVCFRSFLLEVVKLLYSLNSVFSGAERKETGTNYCVVFAKDGDAVQMENISSEAARFVLIAGKPISEPIARHGIVQLCHTVCQQLFALLGVILGPFVMNTQEEIDQTFKGTVTVARVFW